MLHNGFFFHRNLTYFFFPYSPEQVSREDLLLRKHLQAVYQEEQLSNPQDLGCHHMTTISQRPKSLAVPGMTTSCSAFSLLHEPQVTQQAVGRL